MGNTAGNEYCNRLNQDRMREIFKMNHPGNAWLFATAHFIQVNSLPVRRIFNMKHFEAPTDEDLRGKAASDAMHGACGTIRTKFSAGVQKPSAGSGRLLR